MSRGFLSGVAIGAVVSGVGLAGLSVLTPLPERLTSGQMAPEQTAQTAQPAATVGSAGGVRTDASTPDTSGTEDPAGDMPASDTAADTATDIPPENAPQMAAPSEAMAESPMVPAAPKDGNAADTLPAGDRVAKPAPQAAQPQLQQGSDTALETAPITVPTGPAAQVDESVTQLPTPDANQSAPAGGEQQTAEAAPNLADPAKIPGNGDRMPTAPDAQTSAPERQDMAGDDAENAAGGASGPAQPPQDKTAEAPTEEPQVEQPPAIKSAPVAPIGNLAKNVTTGRLPTISADSADDVTDAGDPPSSQADAESGSPASTPSDKVAGDAAQEAAQEATSEAAQEDAKSARAASPLAIERNAVEFTAAGDRPVMAVLLQDVGAERSSLTGLSTLPFPLSVVVEANAPDAEEAIAFYKKAGAEVIVEASLPPAATPTDAEVNFQVQQDVLDQGAAVMLAVDSGFQDDAALAKHVSELLVASGHGLVSHPKGLNTGHRLAIKAGVPAGTVFRDVDGAGQDGRAIRRFLDNAAFKARQRDGVIVFGRARPATVQALIEWSLGNRAKSVALAPVSAVLLGDEG